MFGNIQENIGYLYDIGDVTLEQTRHSLIYYNLSKLGYDISSSRDVYGYSVKSVNLKSTYLDEVPYGGSILLQKAACAFLLLHMAPLGYINNMSNISVDSFSNLNYDFNDTRFRRHTISYGGAVYTDGRYWVIYPCKTRKIDSNLFISVDMLHLTPLALKFLNLIRYESIGSKLYTEIIEILSCVLSELLETGINIDLSDYIMKHYGVYISESFWYDSLLNLLKCRCLSNSYNNLEVVDDVSKVVFGQNSIIFNCDSVDKIQSKDIAKRGIIPIKFAVRKDGGYSYFSEFTSWRGLFLACTDYLLDVLGIDGVLSSFGKEFGCFYRGTRTEFEQEYSENGFNGDKFPSYKGIYYYGPLASIRIVDFLKKVSSKLGVEFIMEYIDK